MDWQIQSLGRQSAVSGDKFAPGEIVVSLIYTNMEGQLARADMLESEEDTFEVEPVSVVGRWKREVKQPGEENDARQQAMQSAEELFLSLFAKEDKATEDSEDLNILKHFLALMLERKRIIRAALPRRLTGIQPYLHVKSKENFEVPVIDVTPEALLKVQAIIDDLTSI